MNWIEIFFTVGWTMQVGSVCCASFFSKGEWSELFLNQLKVNFEYESKVITSQAE